MRKETQGVRTEENNTAHFSSTLKKKKSRIHKKVFRVIKEVSSGDNSPLRNAVQQTEVHLGLEIFL